MTLIAVWIGYAVFGIGAFSAMFIWAVRSRQFTELDRQRYIALRAADSEVETRSPGLADRYTWLVIVVLMLLVIAAALWLAMRVQR